MVEAAEVQAAKRPARAFAFLCSLITSGALIVLCTPYSLLLEWSPSGVLPTLAAGMLVGVTTGLVGGHFWMPALRRHVTAVCWVLLAANVLALLVVAAVVAACSPFHLGGSRVVGAVLFVGYSYLLVRYNAEGFRTLLEQRVTLGAASAALLSDRGGRPLRLAVLSWTGGTALAVGGWLAGSASFLQLSGGEGGGGNYALLVITLVALFVHLFDSLLGLDNFARAAVAGAASDGPSAWEALLRSFYPALLPLGMGPEAARVPEEQRQREETLEMLAVHLGMRGGTQAEAARWVNRLLADEAFRGELNSQKAALRVAANGGTLLAAALSAAAYLGAVWLLQHLFDATVVHLPMATFAAALVPAAIGGLIARRTAGALRVAAIAMLIRRAEAGTR